MTNSNRKTFARIQLPLALVLAEVAGMHVGIDNYTVGVLCFSTSAIIGYTALRNAFQFRP